MRILCAAGGANQGKTTLTEATVRVLRARGERAAAFCPTTSNHVYSAFDLVREQLGRGHLHRADTERLAEASDAPVELVAPCWSLTDIVPALGHGAEIVVGRITLWDGAPHHVHAINPQLLARCGLDDLRAKVESAADEVLTFETFRDMLRGPVLSYLPRALRGAYTRLASSNETIVYDSIASWALPWAEIDRLDAVLVARHGELMRFDGARYLERAKALPSTPAEPGFLGGEGSPFYRLFPAGPTAAVVRDLEPLARVTVPPLPHAELRRGFERAVTELLELA